MIKLVTDSGVSLPPETIADHDIRVVAGTIQFGSGVIPDYPLSADNFYAWLAASPTLPVSRDSEVKDFADIYAMLIAENPTGVQILSLHVSEALASTLTMARNTAHAIDGAEIRIFDTRSVSAGQGLMVHEAAQMIRAGRSLYRIEERLESMAVGMKFFVLLDTLEYLKKGGRISGFQHAVGSMVNVKPILKVSYGNVTQHSTQRTRERGIDALRQMILDDARGKKVRLSVTHAIAPDEAQQLADELKDALNPDLCLITEISPSVGIHTGPRALGIAWFVE